MKKILMIMMTAMMLMILAVPMMSMAEKTAVSGKAATASNYEKDEDDEDEDIDDLDEEEESLPQITSEDGTVTSPAEGEEAAEIEEAKETMEIETAGTETAAVLEEVKPAGPAVLAEDVYGSWTVDGVTDLRFNKDGSGALIVPSNEFPFIWSLEDDSLSLSFEDSAVRDVVYTVSKQGSKITITEGGTSFALKR